SEAGREILAAGGNAVDAAVAVAFALAVSWPEAGNLGGGGFMLVAPADGREAVCVEYRERAPEVASPEMYDPAESRYTHRVVGVPGTVRGLELAHRQYGSLPWGRLLQPAIRLAEEGVEVDQHLAGSLRGVLEQESVRTEARYDELRRVFGHPRQRAWRAGDRLRQPELAATLRRIAEHGADDFYEGHIARQIVAEMRRGGGLISADDLRQYAAVLRTPIRGAYRGYEVLGPPPPSSGGICLVQMLHVLEPLELRAEPRFSARTLHLTTEAMRRAYLDRARHLGDADYVAIPPELTAKEYAERLAREITPDRASDSRALAPDIPLAPEGDQTTHFSVVDSSGMAVSNTYTLEASWGARIVVRGAGFLLNNEMGDFNWQPGVTGRRGQIGTPANLIAPGKRMLSSQTPVIVRLDGRVVLVVGSPGGRTIINTVLNILVSVLEYELPLSDAIAAPRTHHQWLPDTLYFEGLRDERHQAAIEQLRAMGHDVQSRGKQGSAHAIRVDGPGGRLEGVADWRRGGYAAGLPKP
ncbi:MAG: gamma-glutamyltransferase, partial [Pirellulaceae bacterium]|nr:gamma-glutamyltransferase [Pirellulaceae bacterium]